ncbi:hypothetical protein [Maricaulis maris]|uniref:hypothetical protein n=1 Tax=Maricaulis maris TaxID=74318 RepID=UPI003B8DD911
MAIKMEIDSARSRMVWTYKQGEQTWQHFQDHFDAMRASGGRASACRYLVIVYNRGLDISAFDADAMELMQSELYQNHAELFGEDGMEKTAFVCPDLINRLAIEHFLAHSKGRLKGEFRIFDTRPEADAWIDGDET